METAQSGIVIYRASRLEALLGPLGMLLESGGEDVLHPQVVIAAHAGMRQWLATALARRRGPRGIVANLEIVLPSTWLDRLALERLGSGVVALEPYRRAALRWRIHALLEDLPDATLARYLGGADGGRRRLQLADRLARLFTRYLVYRPDWLAAWAEGRAAGPESALLASLWQRLRAQIDRPHRGERLRELVQRLRAESRGGEPPLHLFGLNHLAPSELAVLNAVAAQRLVVLYLPDPCREHWAGLREERALLRERLRVDAFGAETESLFLQQGHPLLARWGRLGQHFMLGLQELETRIDLRHGEDEPEADRAPASRLQRVQASLRRLEPELAGCALGDPAARAAECADRSLRVHACHTRLRELEVLRDALLRERAERPDLKPSEIAVLAPDIGAYAPLLAAVFGEPGRFEGPLPYHLADVPLARRHRAFEGFLRLLDLPGSRLAAPALLDVLGLPEVAARFELDAAALDLIGNWLGNARVAWGLDADWRARFEVPAIEAHTLAWGLDRMLAGHVLGQAAQDGDFRVLALPDGQRLAPLEGVAGAQAVHLGALDAFLRALAALCRDAQQALPASRWAQRLEEALDALFVAPREDAEAAEAIALLRAAIRALGSEPAAAGLDPALGFAEVRTLLGERLAAVPERQPFLLGGVTFCGMVPQRAIPFRVIAVLGLNEGEFPRAERDVALDPMLHPAGRRAGDRDVRSDDRYLFLETLMSAREVLHLSYLGEGAADGKPRNPAAPLAELLAFLETQARGAPPETTDWPWLVRHPLQPFDARYFDGSDVRLFSYRADFAAMRGEAASPGAAAPPPAAGGTLALTSLLDYFRDPVRELLGGRLGVRLDALAEDRLGEDEPLQARFEALDAVARRVFLQCAASGLATAPEQPPDWLRLTGLLPPGVLGEAAWASERERIDALLSAAAGLDLFGQPLAPAQRERVELDLGAFGLRGEVGGLHRHADTTWLLTLHPNREDESELGFRERIPAFLHYAVLRLQRGGEAGPLRLCLLTPDGDGPWQAAWNAWDAALLQADAAARAVGLAGLRARVLGLVAQWQAARTDPASYFPRTSWCAIEGGDDGALLDAWQGNEHRPGGERAYAPGYAWLLGGGEAWEPGDPALARLREVAQRLNALIAPPETSA